MNKADDIICHAPGDRCHGCDHYHGKAPECKYKGERTMDERASDEYFSILLTYIRELNKAHKGIRRLVRRNRKLEAERDAVRKEQHADERALANMQYVVEMTLEYCELKALNRPEGHRLTDIELMCRKVLGKPTEGL